MSLKKNMRKVWSILVMLQFFIGFSGCAEKATPPPQAVDEDTVDAATVPVVNENFSIQTTPSGAEVRLSSGEFCKTPCSLKKKSNDNFDVTVEKRGYKVVRASVISTMRVKPGSGATGKPIVEGARLTPNPLVITLEPNWSKR